MSWSGLLNGYSTDLDGIPICCLFLFLAENFTTPSRLNLFIYLHFAAVS